jgi:hypothetical protein
MELLRVAPMPVVCDHEVVLRALVEHHSQCRHVQGYLTGMIVLSNRMVNIACCILDGANAPDLGYSRQPPIVNVDASCLSF